jgi:cytochrome c553
MKKTLLMGALSWALAAAGLTVAPQDPAAPAAARAQGAKVTYERLGPADSKKQLHSQRARLLSLAVERGETPTPFVAPGLFRATYAATLTLPARERSRFRVEGRGSVKLTINGEPALDGVLRPGKPLETPDGKAVRLKKGDNELALVFESTAMGDGQFRLSWAGADFGFEPIAPERLLSPADDAAVLAGEQLQLGQQLWAERRCARCHEMDQKRVGESAFAELDTVGPDLRQAGARMHQDWLAEWLLDPRRFRPDATMPKLPLTPAEAADLAAWLAGMGAPGVAPAAPDDLATKGRARFRQLGCVACHLEPGAKHPEGHGGRIDLTFVPQKWHGSALVEYLQDPARNHPDVRMPDLKLSRDDAALLANWLLANGSKDALRPHKGDASRGKRLAEKHGCGLCHGLDALVADRQWPRLRSLKAERGCLADDAGKAGAPDHGFDDAQRAALRAFLAHAEEAPFRRAPLDYADRHLTSAKCTQCHALDGMPSAWARWTEQQNAATPLPKDQDPVAQGVPGLTWVGAKLQPSWMERFVTGQEKSPRPWLTARMPAFAKQGATIVQGLARMHGYGAADEPPTPMDANVAVHGDRLLAQGTGFGCVQCHALGDKPAVQVFEREGIELTTAKKRLRHEYYTRWLADPPRVDPDARMPKYADARGKTAILDVLDGDAAKQFEAIWQHLGTRQPR